MAKCTIFKDILPPYVETYFLDDHPNALTISETITWGLKKVRNGGAVILEMPHGIAFEVFSSLEFVLTSKSSVDRLARYIYKGFLTFRDTFPEDEITLRLYFPSCGISSLEIRRALSVAKSLNSSIILMTTPQAGIFLPPPMDEEINLFANFLYQVLDTGFEVWKV